MTRAQAEALFAHLRTVAGVPANVSLEVGRYRHIAAAHFTRTGNPLRVTIRPGTLRLARPIVAFTFAHELGHLLHAKELAERWRRDRSNRVPETEVDADTEAAIILRLADLDLPDWKQVAKLIQYDDHYKYRVQNLYDTLPGGGPVE